MKKNKIICLFLIAILLLLSFTPKIYAESYYDNDNIIVLNDGETISETENGTGTETETTQGENEGPQFADKDKEEKKDKEIDDKKYGKIVMFVLMFGVPGGLLIALAFYSFIVGLKHKNKDYVFYGPELLISHLTFAFACGIIGFGTAFIYVPLVFSIINLLYVIFEMARYKKKKKVYYKFVLTIATIIALVVALALKVSKDKTLDAEFVAAFFMACIVIFNAYDAGKSLAKFLGSPSKK